MIKQLGRYEVIRELGQGAMGVVYQAKDPLIDRVVAIKTINLGLAQEGKDEYEGRFYQEAKAAGRLNHPNIVTIYDVGKSGDVAYIAMEFLQGRELRDIMNDAGLLPIDHVLDMVAQVASGLAYAHEYDIVHRDVKPSNIMVIRDGHVKITDFGIARMASAGVRTQTGMVLGSPKYMSPEQVMGKALDQRSDIFSLGVMLYEMLTGSAPFNGDNVNSIMYQTLNATPALPNTINPLVPEMLNFIVAKALAKGVDDRYQNAKDLAADLRACKDTLPRSNGGINVQVPPVSLEAKLPDAISFTGSMDATDEQAQAAATTSGLSKSFDSAAATMKLAALTSSKEDIDDLSKTLKMPKASAAEMQKLAQQANTLANAAEKSSPVYYSNRNQRASDKGNNAMLLVGLFLVLLAIVGIIIF
ncbi:MAG: serine/threonine-protein kinase [Gallionella sp.]